MRDTHCSEEMFLLDNAKASPTEEGAVIPCRPTES